MFKTFNSGSTPKNRTLLLVDFQALDCKGHGKTHGGRRVAITLWGHVMQGMPGETLLRQMGVHSGDPESPGGGRSGTGFPVQPLMRLFHAGNALTQPRHQRFGVGLFFRPTVQGRAGNGQAAACRAGNGQRVDTHDNGLSG